jgi:hypothetical protein
MPLTRLFDRVTGNVVKADDDDAEFDNIYNNMPNPDNLDDSSADITALRTTKDPYPAEVESLPVSAREELHVLRYLINQINKTSQYYIFPDLKTITNTDSPYTASVDDEIIIADTSSGNITINLPAIAGLADSKKYTVIKSDSANTVTVDGDSGETIDGLLTKPITAQYDTLEIVPDGTEWFSIGKKGLNSWLQGDGRDGAFSSSGSGNIDAGVYYHTTFVLNAGHTLNLANGTTVVIYARDSIVIDGTLSANGDGAAGGAGGSGGGGGGGGANAGLGSASAGGGGGGITGGSGGNGGTASYLGRTQNGGAGAGASGNGGSGTTHPIDQTRYIYDDRIGSGGGGGGSGSAGGPGGNGGNGGGCIILISPSITINSGSSITANGVNGQNGGSTGGAGGGGGAGGFIGAITESLTNDGTQTVTAGTGGTGDATAGDGGNGAAGLIEIVIV